ncbi:MAG: protein kinase domain-containing protein [Nannocystales bacterium]
MASGSDDDTLPGEGVSTTVETPSLRAGDLVDGRYKLVKLLGVGGMGEVWQTEHIALRRPMALKLLRAAELATNRQRARFLREAQVVATIQHPGVIDITDFGELPTGVPFLAMSLLSGQTLQQVVRDDGALPWPRAVSLVQQIADALAEAHRKGVVHRDLKPENVFVSPGPPEHATVIDFGIAGRTTLDSRTAKLTATGSVFGTPGYMSPEQIRGKPADGRADIYALGCVAHELLTGRRVFEGELFERLEAHLYRKPPPLPSTLPPGLARTIERCLAKDPDDRFRSMEELISALARAAGRPNKRTALAPGHVPVAPPGMTTEASRPTVPGLVPEFTARLVDPQAAPESTPQPDRRGVVVALVSTLVGLGVLAALYAAWSQPTTVPNPTVPSAPEAVPPIPAPVPPVRAPSPPVQPQPATAPSVRSPAPVAQPAPAPKPSEPNTKGARSGSVPSAKRQRAKKKHSGPKPDEDGVFRGVFDQAPGDGT